MDKMGSRESMDWSNHHPPLPLSELKKVQRAELACHEINEPIEKEKQKSKEEGFLPRQGTPRSSSWSHSLCPVLTRGQLRHPKCARAQRVLGRTRVGRTCSTKGPFERK